MKRAEWMLLAMLVALLVACSGREQTVTGPSDGALLAGDAVSSSSSSHGGRTRSAPSTSNVEFEGSVKSASATNLVITDRRHGDVTLTVNGDTVIRNAQGTVAAADLKTGDRVHVRAAKTNDALVALLVFLQSSEGENEPAEFEGIVKAISADSLTLTAPAGEIVLQLNAQTVFDPAAPKIGDRVHVRAQKSDGALVALLVRLQGSGDDGGGDDGGEHHGGTTMTANGQVTDTGSSQITVASEDHGSVTVTIDSHTVIRKQGTTIGAADIKKGDFVNARGTRIDDHSLLAEQIEVRGESGRK